MTLTPFTVTVIVSMIIPLLTGLLTKASAPDKVKAAVSLVLSIVGGAFATAVQPDGTAIISQALVQNTALTIAMQLASYLGVYKPILKVNDKLMPKSGLG